MGLPHPNIQDTPTRENFEALFAGNFEGTGSMWGAGQLADMSTGGAADELYLMQVGVLAAVPLSGVAVYAAAAVNARSVLYDLDGAVLGVRTADFPLTASEVNLVPFDAVHDASAGAYLIGLVFDGAPAAQLQIPAANASVTTFTYAVPPEMVEPPSATATIPKMSTF